MNGGGFGVLGEVPGSYLPSGIVGPIGQWEIGIALPTISLPDWLGGGYTPWWERTIPLPPTTPRVPQPVPPPPVPADEEVVAHDWGHIFREVGGSIATSFFQPELPNIPFPNYGPGGMGFVDPPPVQQQAAAVTPAALANTCGLDGQAWGGQAPPRGYKVVNYCGQAVLRKIRRRRRRRMLSVSDKNDIASIVSMVGKGQMASALINRTSP